MGYFLIAYGNLHGQGGDLVRTVHHVVLGSFFSQIGQCRANIYLDTLSHALAHLHIVLRTHVVLDVGREVVASHLDAVVGHDTA